MVEKFVRRLAEHAREYAAPYLRGNRAVFTELRAYVAKESQIVLKRWERERARAEADRARMTGDWAAVAKAYAPIADDLTPVERKRLQYARKHARKAS